MSQGIAIGLGYVVLSTRGVSNYFTNKHIWVQYMIKKVKNKINFSWK